MDFAAMMIEVRRQSMAIARAKRSVMEPNPQAAQLQKAEAKAKQRRFTGQAPTGFGGLA